MPVIKYPNTAVYLAIKSYLSAILNSYSELFFIRGEISGLLIFFIGLLNYNAALCGLFSTIVSYAFAHLIGFNKNFLNSGYYTYNPLLVGLAIGHLFQLSWLTFGLLAGCSILAFVLTVFLSATFQYYLRLQVLSIPFVIVTSIIYLATARFSNLYTANLYISIDSFQELIFLPEYMNAFFKAVGSIIFMPNALAGALISIIILFRSRIIFLLALFGFIVGCSVNAAFIGSYTQSLNSASNFNYVLTAIAIGGVFNRPSPKSYLIAGVAVAVSTLLINAADVFWSQYGLPVFTLPFALITLSFVYLLNLVDSRLRPLIFKETPEKTLDYFLTNEHRFPTTPHTLSLPFIGFWTVWQGFNGRWTHQGMWRYAYDFIVQDADGKSFSNTGLKLEDYYAYKKWVLAPISGRVITVISHLPDNPIGSVDTINNWGNYIVIYDERGAYIELSHFAQHSITVVAGNWIEAGYMIGLCGNSGYSPEPHIHIQAQTTAWVGSETLPFTFKHFHHNQLFYAHAQPKEGDILTSIWPVPYYDQITTFILDEVLDYAVYKKGQLIEKIQLKISMAFDSTFYFSRGNSKLYFGKREGAFFMYHLQGNDTYLKIIYLCLPKMPLNYQAELHWHDTLPNHIFLTHFQNLFASLLDTFMPQYLRSTGHYQFAGESVITGLLSNNFFNHEDKTRITLDPYLKFKLIQFNDYELKHLSSSITG